MAMRELPVAKQSICETGTHGKTNTTLHDHHFAGTGRSRPLAVIGGKRRLINAHA